MKNQKQTEMEKELRQDSEAEEIMFTELDPPVSLTEGTHGPIISLVLQPEAKLRLCEEIRVKRNGSGDNFSSYKFSPLDFKPYLRTILVCFYCTESQAVYASSCKCLCWCPTCNNKVSEILEKHGPQSCPLCYNDVAYTFPSVSFGCSTDKLLQNMIFKKYGIGPLPSEIMIQGDLTSCSEKRRCFMCADGPLEVCNYPCGCPIWCLECKEGFFLDMVEASVPYFHSCLNCGKSVTGTTMCEGIQAIKAIESVFSGLLNDRLQNGKLIKDSQFFRDYFERTGNGECFSCRGPLIWSNMPCGCSLWCDKCLNLLNYNSNLKEISDINFRPPQCPICDAEVVGHSSGSQSNSSRDGLGEWQLVTKKGGKSKGG